MDWRKAAANFAGGTLGSAVSRGAAAGAINAGINYIADHAGSTDTVSVSTSISRQITGVRTQSYT